MKLASPALADTGVPSMGYGDYLRFSRLIHERYGLHFPESRRADLERGIRQAYAASTCGDLGEYYRLLQDPSSNIVQFERLVNAITISETHFFRDAGQVDALYKDVLPRLISRRRTLRTLRIWSAGCASGEEPYSIAMLLRELLPDVDEWSITILGTDINTKAIERARQAVYSEWAFREDRAKEWRPRYFRRRGNRYELIPSVRRMVTFARLNLMEDEYPSYDSNTTLMDLILCRNVMIYFTEPISRDVVERFYNCLTYSGWLVVGHAEHSLTIYRRFQVHNFPSAILYQRTDEAESGPKVWEEPLSRAKERFFPSVLVPTPEEDIGSLPAFFDVPPALPTTERRRIRSTEEEPEPKPEPELDHIYIHTLGRLGHVHPTERAQELLGYGRSEEAHELLLEMVRAGSKDAPVYALLGQACANLGDWDKAEHWCREAIYVDKLALDAYYILALVLQHQGQVDAAIQMMRKVVYIDRHNVLGHFGLADLYHTKDQLPQALKSLDNAGRLLEGWPENEFIPGSGGITVSSLRDAIVRQQQKWGAEASGA